MLARSETVLSFITSQLSTETLVYLADFDSHFKVSDLEHHSKTSGVRIYFTSHNIDYFLKQNFPSDNFESSAAASASNIATRLQALGYFPHA